MNEENEVYETKGTKIKIIGIGGAGGNAINDMISSNIIGVDYVAINTDEQDLKGSKAKTKIALGHLGAGGNPEVSRAAAEDNAQDIKKVIKGQDMVFITAGMGGGTGTGAAPVPPPIPAVIKTISYVDTLIVIPNQKLLDLEGSKQKPFKEHLKTSNNILTYGVKGISELITKEGIINLDFSDVKSIMEDSGVALFGFVESNEGESVEDIVERTVTNPLLEKDIKGATKILVNVTSGDNVTMDDVIKIQELISQKACGTDSDVENLIFGAIYEQDRTNIVLSVIATGFDAENNEEEKKEEETMNNLFNTENSDENSFLPNFDGYKL